MNLHGRRDAEAPTAQQVMACLCVGGSNADLHGPWYYKHDLLARPSSARIALLIVTCSVPDRTRTWLEGHKSRCNTDTVP